MSDTNLPDMETLEAKETALVERVLQRVTLDYRQAIELETKEEGYLQGSDTKAPEKTVGFRMDSKQTYLVQEDNAQDAKIARESLYFFVPTTANPEVWLDRFWVKHINRRGIEAMFVIDKDGARIHASQEDIEAEEQELDTALAKEVDVLDFSAADMITDFIERKQLAIRGIQKLIDATRDEFKIVPYYS